MGEYGVGAAAKPAARRAASASCRVPLSRLTRRSSGAASLSARSSAPTCAVTTTRCAHGRWWRPVRSRSCARLRPQAFEQRGAYPRAEGGLEARPQRHGTLEAERRPLRLRLVAAALAAAARTTGRPRGRRERSLGLQRERERAQPGRLRRAHPRQRCGAARAAHRDEPPAREEARPRRWAHARTAQAQVEAALAARDAVELRGDRGARLGRYREMYGDIGEIYTSCAEIAARACWSRPRARAYRSSSTSSGAPHAACTGALPCARVCARVRACVRVCEGV